MSVHLVLEHVAGEHLLDDGTIRRVCLSGEDLLEGLRDATREPSSGASTSMPESTGLVISVDAVKGGWLLRWVGAGKRQQSVIVRDDPDSADRAWSQLSERAPSVRGIVDRLEQVAYGGAPNEALSFELGGAPVEITREQLRFASKGLRLFREIGKMVSISPKPAGKGGGS